MTSKYWRDWLEIVVALSVVGGLLLVAWEIRQANGIARAQTVLELAAGYNEINSARFEDPEVARLVLLLQYPDKYEVSDIEASMITGLAFHIHNILWSAQIAYDNGLLTLEDIDIYRNDLEQSFEDWPRILPDLINIYRSQPGKKAAYVFEPLAEKAAEFQVEPASSN